MAILGGILLTFFVIVAILLILIVMLQDEQGEGLGGIFGGSSNSSIGLQTGNVLSKFTGILATLFIVLALSLMMIYTRTGKTKDNVSALTEESGIGKTWYKDIVTESENLDVKNSEDTQKDLSVEDNSNLSDKK